MKAEQLRKAILQIAIQGKLVPQNPNDEPASVLLEKIRAEKQKIIKEGKIKKDKVDSVIFRGEDNRHYEKVGNNAPVCIEDELPFEIPESWEWVRLGNAYNIVMGQSPNGNSVGKNCNGIEFHQGKICFGKKYLQVSEQKTTMPTKIIKEDAVVLCVRAPVGKVNIVERTICIGRGLCAVMPFISTSIEFIYLLLQTYEDIFNKKATGTTFKAISNEVVFNQTIPLPPLAEQERIVAEIEKYEPLIAEYDKLEQEKSKLDSEIYDKLKKSILQYAIQGKLVPQDERDEPASELLKRIRVEKKAQLGKKYMDSYIYKGDDNCYYEHIEGKAQDEAIETPFDLPNNWTWARWGELSYSIQYGYNAPAKTNGRIKMVRISDIHNNEVDWANVPFCDIAEKEISTYLLKENDILFARTGGTVGKSYLVTVVPEEAIYAGYLIRTRYSSELSAQYLKFFMESSLYWDQLRDGTIATAQPNCNGQTLSKMLLPIPPLAEQKRIVNKINKIFVKL